MLPLGFLIQKLPYQLSRHLMKHGLGTKSLKILFKIFKISKKKEKTKDPNLIISHVLTKLQPMVYVRNTRKGSQIKEIPMKVFPEKKTYLAIKWLRARTLRKLKESQALYLYKEIRKTLKGTSLALKQRDLLYLKAFLSRSSSHLKWNVFSKKKNRRKGN